MATQTIPSIAALGGIVAHPGEGTALQFTPDEHLLWKATGATTGGALDVGELRALPQAGPPEHIHHWNDETFYVLDGRFSIKVGDQHITAQPGSFVLVPRGTPHAWRATGAAPGRMLVAFIPGGVDRYFADLAPLLVPGVTLEQLRPVLERYGVEIVGPPLAD